MLMMIAIRGLRNPWSTCDSLRREFRVEARCRTTISSVKWYSTSCVYRIIIRARHICFYLYLPKHAVFALILLVDAYLKMPHPNMILQLLIECNSMYSKTATSTVVATFSSSSRWAMFKTLTWRSIRNPDWFIGILILLAYEITPM